MRKAHYLPGNRSNETPQACIWFDTETRGHIGTDGREYHTLWFGWAVYQRRRTQTQWTKPEWLRFTSIEEFWQWVISKTRKKTRLHLFAHNGAFDLPVMHAFSVLPQMGYELKKAVADAPPLILSWTSGGKTIRFIDTLNIWRQPLQALGTSVGLRKLTMPDADASQARWDAYGRRDVKVIWRACRAWFDFLTDNDLGGFQPTLASQAFASYRHRFMPVKILIDADEESIAMARNAYVGGRTECFRLGTHNGAFYYIDVNSMYPSVMRNNLYPRMLLGTYGNIDPDEVDNWLENDTVIAECTITTDEPVYPVVHEGRLIFPVGTFNLSLATPEFRYAWQNGHVSSINRMSVYDSADLFTGFIDTLYGLRLGAKAKGDNLNTWLYKILMNSLYGKFGQRGRRYKELGSYDPDVIEVWQEFDADSGEWHNLRAFGGLLQEWIDEGESYHSFPALAAHVTSYARMVLWETIRCAGLHNCLYCDTDSLVVTAEGYDRVSHLIDPDAIGSWALDRQLSHVELYGPKDYIFDDVQRVKGVRKNAAWIQHDTVEQDQFVGLKGLLRSGSLDAPIIFRTTKRLEREYKKGIKNPDGTVSPLRLPIE